MNNSELINKTIAFVKEKLNDAEGGHDWFHIERVYKTAQTINAQENANSLKSSAHLLSTGTHSG